MEPGDRALRPMAEGSVAMHNLRTHITAGLTLIALAGLSTGCGTSSGTPVTAKTSPHSTGVPSATKRTGEPVVLDEHANGKVVHVRVGTTIELLLHSSYWRIHRSTRPAILAPQGQPTQLPVTPTCAPGIGCNPVREMFLARAPGTAVLSASRTTCGEALRCGPQNSRYRVTVIITG